MELNDIPEAFQSRLRLMIISALTMGKKSFSDLKHITGATDGNLSVQIGKLESYGYLRVNKLFSQKKPMTVCEITDIGLRDFRAYVSLLNRIVSDCEDT